MEEFGIFLIIVVILNVILPKLITWRNKKQIGHQKNKIKKSG